MARKKKSDEEKAAEAVPGIEGEPKSETKTDGAEASKPDGERKRGPYKKRKSAKTTNFKITLDDEIIGVVAMGLPSISGIVQRRFFGRTPLFDEGRHGKLLRLNALAARATIEQLEVEVPPLAAWAITSVALCIVGALNAVPNDVADKINAEQAAAASEAAARVKSNGTIPSAAASAVVDSAPINPEPTHAEDNADSRSGSAPSA